MKQQHPALLSVQTVAYWAEAVLLAREEDEHFSGCFEEALLDPSPHENEVGRSLLATLHLENLDSVEHLALRLGDLRTLQTMIVSAIRHHRRLRGMR